jgi:hypothetical protein
MVKVQYIAKCDRCGHEETFEGDDFDQALDVYIRSDFQRMRGKDLCDICDKALNKLTEDFLNQIKEEKE